ncbi:AAA family ATPase [Paraburkholderia sp. BR10936]|uniref:AAA family ATPase n=1 Tax=Paraburkholderia sp. BR10936 TaxID=3236993 RepID=UPI0034D32CA3
MTAIITTVGGQKGGTGKSMITGNLAACAARLGARVGVIDTDFSQNTTDKWHISRSNQPAAAPIDCTVRTGPDMEAQLDEWLDADAYDHIFIDTNGSDSYELRKALTRSHWFLSPIKPQPADNWTLGTVESLLLGAREFNPQLRCRVIVSCAPTHAGRRAMEIRSTLQALKQYPALEVCRTVISDRAAYLRAWLAGQGVTELASAKLTTDAMEEVSKLHQEIYL